MYSTIGSPPDSKEKKEKKEHKHPGAHREHHHRKERKERKAHEKEHKKSKKHEKELRKLSVGGDDERLANGSGKVVSSPRRGSENRAEKEVETPLVVEKRVSGPAAAIFGTIGASQHPQLVVEPDRARSVENEEDLLEGEDDDDDDEGGWFNRPLSQFIFTGAMYKKDEAHEAETSYSRKLAAEVRENFTIMGGTEELPIFNLRDLSDATSSGDKEAFTLQKRKIYRSACISRGGITTQEAGRILNYIRDIIGVHTIIDFRNKKERSNDPHDKLVEAFYPTVSKNKEFFPRQTRRYRIKLMNQQFKIVGLFFENSTTKTKMGMLKAAMGQHDGKTASQVFAESSLNPIGLLGLNKLMLQFGGSEIVAVMRVCSEFENYPIMYHCSSGKDRTGLISAFLLWVCGVPEDLIISNYALSQIFLKPTEHLIAAENGLIGLQGFDGTPPEVMRDTFIFLRTKWGTMSDYLTAHGFGVQDQKKLKNLLLHHGNSGALKQSLPVFGGGGK